MSVIKRAIKTALNSLGYELRRRTPASNQLYDLVSALTHFNVDMVLDVGANTGQFARTLRAAGYAHRVVSFEPLQAEHQSLSLAASKDTNWHVHARGALGSSDGEALINVAANSVSSSVLPMLDAHRAAAQESSYVSSQAVPMFKLDSVVMPYIKDAGQSFLKIDAQGFESHVLDGARETLPLLKGVLCELSLVPLYQGQALWLAIIERLERQGFSLWSLRKGFTDRRNGRTLQVDAAFFRE